MKDDALYVENSGDGFIVYNGAGQMLARLATIEQAARFMRTYVEGA